MPLPRLDCAWARKNRRAPWASRAARNRRTDIRALSTAPERGLNLLGALDRLGVVRPRAAGDGVLELAHALAERAAGLGQPLRAEDDEGDDEQDDQFRG